MRLDAPSHLLACCTVAMLLVSVSRTFQSDVVMCSTSQRARRALRGAQRRPVLSAPNAVPSTMQMLAENDGQRKRVNMRSNFRKVDVVLHTLSSCQPGFLPRGQPCPAARPVRERRGRKDGSAGDPWDSVRDRLMRREVFAARRARARPDSPAAMPAPAESRCSVLARRNRPKAISILPWLVVPISIADRTFRTICGQYS